MEQATWLLLLVAVLLFALCVIGEALYRKWITSRGHRSIPYQTALPMVGNGLFFAKAKNLTEFLEVVEGYMPDQPIAGVWFFNKLFLMVNEPEYIEVLLTKCAWKPEELYNIFYEFSNGVFLRNGKEWANMRKPLNKLMHLKNSENWLRPIIRNAAKCTKTLEEKKPIDLHNYTSRCAMNVLLETIMGVKKSTMNDEELDGFTECLKKTVEELFMSLVSLTRKIGFLYRWTRDWKILQLRKTEGKLFINNIIKEQLDKDLTTTENHDGSISYIDLVLKTAEEEGIDWTDASPLVLDIFIAGTDTTSTTIANAILFLAMHPEQQETAYEEQRDIFGDSDREPDIQDLGKMQFLEKVINETLRLSGVPGVGRKLERAVEIDGYYLPKNASIIFRFSNTSKDPRWWEKPKQFYPDHFSDNAVIRRPKGAFTPFGRGNRSCPGRLHALLGTKVTLSTLLRRYQFFTPLKFEEIKFRFGFMLTPEMNDVVAHPRISKNLDGK